VRHGLGSDSKNLEYRSWMYLVRSDPSKIDVVADDVRSSEFDLGDVQ
jgi:hypothetical protein